MESNVKDIQGLVERSLTTTVGDKVFSSVKLTPVVDDRSIKSIMLSTLTGLVEYIKADVDKINKADCLIIIDEYNAVRLATKLNAETKSRDHLVVVALDKDEESRFPFGQRIDHEDFMIKLLSLFADTYDRRLLIEFVAKLTIKNEVKLEDNGVSQLAQVNRGISGALKDTEKAPAYVKLAPFRTFREIDQPESTFLFRMKAEQSTPLCSLYEAEGGAWQSEAKKRIKDYLEKHELGINVIA